MREFIFHNPFLRGVGLLVLVEMVLFLLMVRNRKPGASRTAAVFDPNALTERGLRVKKWCDAVSAAVLVWIVVAVIVKAVVIWLNPP
jgi:hypothetical protein